MEIKTKAEKNYFMVGDKLIFTCDCGKEYSIEITKTSQTAVELKGPEEKER